MWPPTARTYREMAGRLVMTGRLPEAEQALRLVKEEEFYQFAQRDAKEVPAQRAMAQTVPETEATPHAPCAGGAAVALCLAARRVERRSDTRTAGQTAELTRLRAENEAVNIAYANFVRGLGKQLGAAGREQIQEVEALESRQGPLVRLREAGAGEAAVVQTMSGGKQFFRHRAHSRWASGVQH